MKNVFLFDCDGTLTPSRGKINEDFRSWMVDFCENNSCVLVTGSDQDKTIEQIGEYLYNKFLFQFQCNANQIWAGTDTKIHESEWQLPEDARLWLERALYASEFCARTGRHFEDRPGMLNFSVVGRNATQGERNLYIKYDQQYKERETIASHFNTIYNARGIQAQIGGETGLDITPIGNDKRKAVSWLDQLSQTPIESIYFFGDACQEGGNDYPVAKEIMENNRGFVYNVKDYKETWNILKEIK